MTDLAAATGTVTDIDPAEAIAQLTVWGKTPCVQCDATEKDLERKGIPFEKKDLTEHPEMLAEFRANNLLQAPVVTFEDMIWSGFRPDKHIEVLDRIR